VKRHVAPALYLEQLDALASEKLGRRDEMLPFGRPTERDYRWVLYEKEHVLGERPGDPIAGDVPLQLERLLIGNAAQRNCP
jgi:hypothetical protein